MNDSIRTEFKYHPLNDKGAAECNTIREAFSSLLVAVEGVIGPSRERSLVVTKLQEACRWAVSAAAQKPDNQAIDIFETAAMARAMTP